MLNPLMMKKKMTQLDKLSKIVDELITHRVDVVINEDNEWFDELIDNKIQEHLNKKNHDSN